MVKFKEARTAKGLTQKYVALTLGVSIQAISYWENGSRMPGHDNIQQLADLYGVSVDYLLGREQPEPTPLDQKRTEILQKLESLPEDKLEDVLRYAEFVAQRK